MPIYVQAVRAHKLQLLAVPAEATHASAQGGRFAGVMSCVLTARAAAARIRKGLENIFKRTVLGDVGGTWMG
jgi:hypothetical protein